MPNPDEMAGEVYTGEMKIDQLEKFLNQYAYSKPKVVKSVAFNKLDERKYKSSALCGAKNTSLCVLINAGFSQTEIDMNLQSLNPIVNKFEHDPVEFAYVSEAEHPQLFQKTFDGHPFVIYKPKRNKYAKIKVLTPDFVANTISEALGGGLDWKKTSHDGLVFGKISDEL